MRVGNQVNKDINLIKKEHWEKFTKGMKRDLNGLQKKIRKIIRRQSTNMNKFIQIDGVSGEP